MYESSPNILVYRSVEKGLFLYSTDSIDNFIEKSRA